LIGDSVYGGRRKLPKGVAGTETAKSFERQALHATSLGFTHPVSGVWMLFESHPPDDFSELLRALRG
jgi:23S rRNA pseudouridine1911/1915/1917 synthase